MQLLWTVQFSLRYLSAQESPQAFHPIRNSCALKLGFLTSATSAWGPESDAPMDSMWRLISLFLENTVGNAIRNLFHEAKWQSTPCLLQLGPEGYQLKCMYLLLPAAEMYVLTPTRSWNVCTYSHSQLKCMYLLPLAAEMYVLTPTRSCNVCTYSHSQLKCMYLLPLAAEMYVLTPTNKR